MNQAVRFGSELRDRIGRLERLPGVVVEASVRSVFVDGRFKTESWLQSPAS